MKLHLTAKVPNEGARRLARWVMVRHAGDLIKAASVLIISPIVIQRIVSGEITPGTIVGGNLYRHVGITVGHFSRRPVGSWFDNAVASQAVAA